MDDDGSDLWKWAKLISVKKEEELKMVATLSPVMEEAATYLREVSEDKKKLRDDAEYQNSQPSPHHQPQPRLHYARQTGAGGG